MPRLPAAFLPLLRRHAEAEDTGAAVTWAVSAELTSELTWVASEELAWKELAKAALAVSAELASEVLAEVTWRAFTEVTLAMERAFAEVVLQFQQRLRLGKLRYPAVTTVLMHPRPHLAQSQIRR